MGPGSQIKRPVHIEYPECITIGARCSFGPRGRIVGLTSHAGMSFKPAITVGDDVYIGSEFYIVSSLSVTVGSGCVLSDHVYINDTSHGMDPSKGLIMDQPLESKGPIEIGEHCFLGYRTIVLPGVRLGHHCVVGAGSVVTRSFPPYSVIAGAPARLIRIRSGQITQEPSGSAEFECGTTIDGVLAR